ncbi:MAG TPA: hypothetical protein VGP47_07845 [Parachlamydiaceae bacterium]|nr:hypothetical protein [Parachlamydiaceae bacterium]
MENKKQQSKTPASSPNKTQQQPSKNGQMPNQKDNKSQDQQKKPGSNW